MASAGRQTGTTLGVAISGTIVGSALARGGPAFTEATHTVWWIVVGLGLVILALGLITTSPWALASAQRAATLFDDARTQRAKYQRLRSNRDGDSGPGRRTMDTPSN